MLRFTGWVIAVFCIAETVFGQATLVRDGEVRAVVVTAAKPSQVAVYAVEELVRHVEKATGRQLPVAIEYLIIPGTYDEAIGELQVWKERGQVQSQGSAEERVYQWLMAA